MGRKGPIGTIAALALAIVCLGADGSWLKDVPEADRGRVNPYTGQAEAIAAGKRVFGDHCAKCHGPDAMGKGKRPSLRSDRVQHATDGEIFWLLKNGNLRKGMPTWARLPEPMRWQIIAYVKSLGAAAGVDGTQPAGGERQ
ncbi:MAG TPA: c-type cytochrome [Candidatus Limnocylindrales bacterium]|nr:c-type cytochrome [Candidatus Limnocylindrales bacterium]